PLLDITEQFRLAVAELDVGEPLRAVVAEVVGERAVQVGVAALAEDGAVADRLVAAAVVAGTVVVDRRVVVAVARARGAIGGAAVRSGRAGAGSGAGIEVGVVVVGAQERAPRDLRARGGAVPGRVLDVALVGPQRLAVGQLHADQTGQAVPGETGGQAQLLRL